MKSKARTRRDRCYVVGRRMAKLDSRQSAIAWHHLANAVEKFGDIDIPKFNELLQAIRDATLKARR